LLVYHKYNILYFLIVIIQSHIFEVVDEKRSCIVDANTNPIHITSSTSCGSNSLPWIVEAPVGQKISISLIDFTASDSSRTQISCRNLGVIVDKADKKNTSICVGGTQREKKLYSSTGNVLNIFMTHSDQQENERKFLLRLQGLKSDLLLTWLSHIDNGFKKTVSDRYER